MKRTGSNAETNEPNKKIDLNAYFIFGAIVLVFLLGMYAIFSPGMQSQGNPACGKIVIAADGPTLRANVAPTLQDAMYFLVVDPLSSKLVEVVRNPYQGGQPSAQIAYLVAGKGEEAVIVGNIDQQSYNILMQFGIRTFGGYTGQAKKVISLYRQARISAQSPMPETLPQASMQGQQPILAEPQAAPAQAAAWGAQPTYPGPVYPNAFQGGANCPIPGSRQGWAQPVAATGLPDGDTIRSNNVVSQVAWGQPQPPADVANNPLWERAAATVQPAQQGGITWELAAQAQQIAAQQAALAQQAATVAQQAAAQQPPADVANNPLWERAAAQYPQTMAQQAALAQQPPADVANNPLWERAAATVQPAQQGGITWELAAQAQQIAAQQAALAQQAATVAQQAAAQQPPADVANNPLWERAAAQSGQGQYVPVGGAQGYAPQSQYPAAQYPQANNAFAPVAAQTTTTAPPIYSNAQMPHAYRGNCIECHQIIDAPANNQNTQVAANSMMWNNNMAQDQNSVRAGVGNGVR